MMSDAPVKTPFVFNRSHRYWYVDPVTLCSRPLASPSFEEYYSGRLAAGVPAATLQPWFD